jgi:hypothetical protein
MIAEKTCPKCPNSPTMIRTDRFFMIPAMAESKAAKAPISDRMGAPVQIYECPHCHLVELYHREF